MIKRPRCLRSSGGHHSSRKGFTLAELMVVILILSIMSSLVLASLSGGGGSEDLNTAVSRISKYAEYAQSSAFTQKTPVRLAIHYDPTDTDRFLKYFLIFYFDADDNTWRPLDEGQFLPPGIFFSPGLSTPLGGSTLMGWTAPVDWNLFEVTSFTPSTPFTSAFASNEDQLQGAGVGNWVVYEFASNGTFMNAGQRLVMAEGLLTAVNQLRIPNEELVDGFMMFRAGRPAHFQAPEQIRGE